MFREGHIGAALLVYAPLGALVLGNGFKTLAIAGAVIAVLIAMAPDVDMQLPGVPHRGPTHSIWFALVLGLALGACGAAIGRLAGGQEAMVMLGAFGFGVGFLTTLSHIIADMLTPAGVRFFSPVNRGRYSLGLVRASNPVANYALFLVGILAVAGALQVGPGFGELIMDPTVDWLRGVDWTGLGQG